MEMIRKCIDGTYHRVDDRNGYLWYADPKPDELNQPVRPVPESAGGYEIPKEFLHD